jgi:hypothetical protein
LTSESIIEEKNVGEMSIYTTPNFAALGSLNLPAFFPVPPLMNFVAGWAALVPLVCHLASYHHAHQLVGQVTLLGRVSVGLFPKLGVLAGMLRLVERGPEYLDAASTLGISGRKVWDVRWNSTPSANGAASNILAESLLSYGHDVIRVPEGVPSTILPQFGPNSVSTQGITVRPSFRRYQTLHLLHFSKTKLPLSWPSTLDKFISSPAFDFAAFAFKLSIVIILCFFGTHGTATTLI